MRLAKLRLVALIVVVLASALLWWQATDRAAHSRAGAQSTGANEPSDSEPAALAVSSSSAALEQVHAPLPDALPDAAQPAVRAPLPAAALAGQLLGANGAPVADARLRWIAIAPRWCAFGMPSAEVDWDAVDAVTLEARSDQSGAFRFESEPEGVEELPSVVWIEASGWRTTPVLLGAGERRWPAELRLAAAAPLEVEFVFRDLGVPHLPVRCVAPLDHARLSDSELRDPGLAARRGAFRVWRLDATTDDAGQLRVAAHDAPVHARAMGAQLRSAAQRLHADQRTRIELCEAAVVAGTLTGFDLDYAHESMTLEILSWTEQEGYVSVDMLPVRADGSFGPAPVPAPRMEVCVVRPRGRGVLEVAQFADALLPGETRRLDLQVTAGLESWVQICDASGSGIPFAKVVASWTTPEHYVAAHAASDELGMVRLRGLEQVNFDYEVSCPGWATRREVHAFTAGYPRHNPYRIELSRAASVRGRVLRNGEPETSFVLVYWSRVGEHWNPPAYLDVQHPEGEFELRELPLAPLSIYAASDVHGSSPMLEVALLPDAVPELELELESAGVVRGRVVSAASLEPVAGVEVQQYFTDNQRRPLERMRGTATYTDAQGRFELRDAARSAAPLRLLASGYAPTGHILGTLSDAVHDTGDIALMQLCRLELRIHASPEIPLHEFLVLLSHRASRRLELPGSGEALVVSDLEPGDYELSLGHSDLGAYAARFSLRSGEARALEFRLGGECALDLSLDLPPERFDELADPSLVIAFGYGTDLPFHARYRLRLTDSGLRAQLTQLVPGPAQAVVYTKSGSVLWSRPIELTPGTLRISERVAAGPRTALVVDEAGTPLEGITVALQPRDFKSGLAVQAVSDREGRARFGDVESGPWVASLHHGKLGDTSGLEIEFAASEDDPPRLLFAPIQTVRLRLLDGDEPQSGVSVVLTDGAHDFLMRTSTTDAEGRVVFERVAAQVYAVQPGAHALWARRVRLEAQATDAEQVLQVRRLGRLALELRDASGAAVSGASVELESLEFGELVSAWVAEERIDAAPADLRSDAAGRVVLSRIPHGKYRCRVQQSEGAILERVLDVAPGHGPVVVLQLP